MRNKLLILLCVLSWGAHAEEVVFADRVLIEKKAHTLTLYKDDKVLKTYHVSLGPNITGPKQQQGDGKTPEGNYVIASHNAHSHYHRALKISYPNARDRERARKLHVEPGGDIMIHGLPNGQGWVGKAHLMHDWTLGCIAVTDPEIEEIYALVPVGTPVEILP